MLTVRLPAPPAPRRSDLGWVAVYALLLAAWGALWVMDPAAHLPPEARALGLEALRALCLTAAADADVARLAAMWAVMGAAMMLPTALPALRAYADLSEAAARRGAEAAPAAALAGLVAGYLAVWAWFAVAAAVAQAQLSGAGALDALGRPQSAALTALLLAAAGAWQFTPWKAACLSRCRAPLTVFLARWRPGPRAAFAAGLRMGLDCLVCCWALMALGFVGGAMSLAWMGAATALMALEKLPRLGRPLTAPLGAALLGAAAAAAWTG